MQKMPLQRTEGTRNSLDDIAISTKQQPYCRDSSGVIYCGDCLDLMKDWPDGCVDLVLTDPPYGTTACKWDTIIPLEPMWKQLKRLIKSNGAIVMTASQPFTTTLIASNIEMFKYCWVWEKPQGTGHLNAKLQPLKNCEDVVVFYEKQCIYNPQMVGNKQRKITRSGLKSKTENYGKFTEEACSIYEGRYPVSLVKFDRDENIGHPTQKPIALMEYLIRTYTDENNTILDFACGSGTTCVAAKMLGRRYIGIDISEEYCQIARDRLRAVDTGVPVKEARAGQGALFD